MPKGKKAIFDFSRYKNIEADYLSADVWSEDGTTDERYSLLKAVQSLTLPERRILLTYAECGTYAETARIFKVNAKTVSNYISKLRIKINNILNKGLNDIS